MVVPLKWRSTMAKRKGERSNDEYSSTDDLLFDIDNYDLLAAANRARQGEDQEARERLALDPKIGAICRKLYLNGLFRGRDKELGDLEQELRLKILANIEKAKEFKDLKGYYSWVKEIARNICFSAYRKDKYLLAGNIVDALENLDNYFASPFNGDDLLLQEVVEILEAKSGSLDAQTFILIIVEGFSVQEVAELLDCSRETVYRHYRNLLAILAPYLKKAD